MLLPLCNFHPLNPPKTLLYPSPSLPFFSTTHPLSLKPFFSRSSIPVFATSPNNTSPLPESAIQRIANKLRSLGYIVENPQNQETTPENSNSSSAGQIFVPLPSQLPKYRVGHTLDVSWSTPENPVPQPGLGNSIQKFHELRGNFLKEKEKERLKNKDNKKERAPSLAELTLPAEELRRLRTLGIGLRKKLKIGKAGITEGIVNGIHERWRRIELVKITCEDLCRLNMKRTHELLERKTGGLVIWRSGSNIILYRGADYKYPYFSESNSGQDASPDLFTGTEEHTTNSSDMDAIESDASDRKSPTCVIRGVGSPDRVRFQLPGEAELTEEADKLLEGLGPRFTDWWGCEPLPIDADLLPAVVPGYKKPFRLLPYGVKPKLTNDEMTTLKRLGRPLPCHFALGRNRKLQGLAAAIVKLWEKCEIAKVAVKRGVQNTNSELMAEELKWLTGGTLLSRDKEFIVFYRGKDFLPSAVSSAIAERRKQVVEEEKKSGFSSSVANTKERKKSIARSVSDDEHANQNDQKGVQEKKKLTSMEAAIKRTADKLATAIEKKAKAEQLLVELEEDEMPQQADLDKEGITEEERFMLRKIGLRMKPFLLLGRRGVFDGTVENMHLHWKYRELVKVITGRKSIEEVNQIARMLEGESGGILVAVERVNKGYAIIVYRGKNYERPASLRPQTLLSKREAMKRSIEAQRRQSLKLHVLKLTQNIEALKSRLTKSEEMIHMQSPDIVGLQVAETGTSNAARGTNCQSSLASPCTSEDCGDAVKDTDHSSQKELPSDSSETDHSSEQELPSDSSFQYESKAEAMSDTIQPQRQSISSTKESKSMFNVNVDEEAFGSAVDESVSKSSRGEVKIHFSETRSVDKLREVDYRKEVSEVDSVKPQQELRSNRSRSEGMPPKKVHLSNRERLLLRKQALKMKQQPVLAVGRSNIVTGVAKAIKAHFKKYPLAIVNVKGRAKGTSVREVVFKLEQATGAVLVSQEPSKVILYRGWGPEGQRGASNRNGIRDSRNSREHKDQLAISPELISAIRLECGLQADYEMEVAS
ncbi:PREDICTED: CRM-domain containing factor CFM2, chloroplastic [Nicotiana attenuata]|uniref:Crm-domain containing factor cfm2, chloroplastic n=1 Tax=Nicotiana attenuata TaxID=49451 RepID=A0A1J6IM36_NICAT|nr:PREDICTED: CRM-domain containing factor CFM2, chloroplastic [Nicotiana attenuata]OIT05910.1 crm-domain containing factor cfm2, chloroplastic [Nicotiana attenuata]